VVETPANTSARSLQLSQPLAVLDVQSTGLDVDTARIVKLSVIRLDPDGSEQVKSVLVNPEMPIPRGATLIHGITDLDVIGKPVFRAYARSLANHIGECDLAGFGIERFGLPLLLAEFERSGVEFLMKDRAIVDAMVVFHRLEPRNLASAYRQFVGEALPETDDESQTARNVLDILNGELRSAPEVPDNPREISAWSKGFDENAIDSGGKFIWSDGGKALVNFGKHRGELLSEVAKNDPEYLSWILRSGDFDSEVLEIAESATTGIVPERGFEQE